MIAKRACTILLGIIVFAAPAIAGLADVVQVDVAQESGEQWRFAVTVRHPDHDPDHWADYWRVRTPEGRELGRRVLLHSHVDEQPFTRDEVIHIPRDVRIVVVEAHDKVHGLGGRVVTIDLTKPRGSGYTVKRR